MLDTLPNAVEHDVLATVGVENLGNVRRVNRSLHAATEITVSLASSPSPLLLGNTTAWLTHMRQRFGECEMEGCGLSVSSNQPCPGCNLLTCGTCRQAHNAAPCPTCHRYLCTSCCNDSIASCATCGKEFCSNDCRKLDEEGGGYDCNLCDIYTCSTCAGNAYQELDGLCETCTHV